MRVLIACECSGIVRSAFRALGHDAWSCDLKPAEDGSVYHIQGDIRGAIGRYVPPDTVDSWDLMIAHPTCTRLTNSGVRWLHTPPKGRTLDEMWQELEDGAEFYKLLRDAPIPKKAIENPIMHKYAMERIQPGHRQFVQPWWFGDEAFKATGFELIGLPELEPTDMLTPPEKGTEEHKRWSKCHMESPGPDRAANRSRSYPGMAQAMALQWGAA